MKKKCWLILLSIILIILGMVTGGCSGSGLLVEEGGSSPTPRQPSATPTVVDLCSNDNKPGELQKIVRLMRRFDDTSMLAQATPQQQLAAVILEMQNVMHDAEDLNVPGCLDTLQSGQLNYMQAVIATMANFLSGANSNAIGTQINATRQLRTTYEAELASQMGLPYYTVTPMPAWTATPVTPTSTPAPVTILTDQDLYVLQGPGVGYPAIGTFLVGQTTNAIGRTEDQQWLEIELVDHPGYTGWVPVELVVVNGSMGDLAVVPTPAVQ